MKELDDLQARLYMSGVCTRQRECKLEDVCAVAEAGLEDARTAANACVIESKLEHEYASIEEELKRTMQPGGRMAFLEL